MNRRYVWSAWAAVVVFLLRAIQQSGLFPAAPAQAELAETPLTLPEMPVAATSCRPE